MSIGLGIFLFVIGAILVWAVNVELDAVNLDMIGYIMMGAGAIVVLIGLVLLATRRRSISTTRVANDPASGDRVVRSESSTPGNDVV